MNKKEILRIIKFTLFSISAGIIQILSFTLLETFFKSLGYLVIYLISLTLSVLWNFTLNRNYTFKSSSNVKVAMIKVLIFYLMFTPVSSILGDLASSKGINDYVILIITMLFNLVLEFLYERYIVFGKSIDSRK